MKKFLIIDGNNIAYRAFYALPKLTNFDGVFCNAILGFTNVLLKAIEIIKPEYVAVAFDKGKNTFRHKMYKEYKALRSPTPTELISQFPLIKELLSAMKIKVMESNDIEADDIIGILAKSKETDNIILSADKDVFQLINENTFILSPQKGISDISLLNSDGLKEKYNLTPHQIIDLKSLMGDASDNIPGVAGVGEKTALALLSDFGDLDGVYKNIEKIKGKLQEKLIANKKNAYFSKSLATIKTDYDLKVKLEDFKLDFPFDNDVVDFFKKFQFNSLLSRKDIFKDNLELEKAYDKVENKKDLETINEVKNLIEIINCKKECYLFLEANCLSIYVDNCEYNIKFIHNLLDTGFDYENIIQLFKPILEDAKIIKNVFDSKSLAHILYNSNILLDGVEFDAVIARYLLNSNGKANITFKDLIYENSFSESNIAYNLFLAKNKFMANIKKYNLEELYKFVELPLAKVLFDMENQGFKIDVEELKSLNNKYNEEILEIKKEIYNLAGHEFNINSPKQLSEILFNELNLKSYNNKKNSTNVDILKDLVGLHPIIQLILDYRKITKLNGTYIEAFLNMHDKRTHTIHTIFNQTLTSTGRLSSSEPNLQNIPVRTEEGKNIRKVFISRFEKGSIITADYSQIELRLLASFSGDKKLIDAFNANKDIHTQTASEIFNVPQSAVTASMRRDAKSINFGIIYGISDYGLSQNIGSTREKANQYIKTYFEKYPLIEQYMKSNVDSCRKLGYVKTIMGRIRFIPEINSNNYNLRTFGERAAMNMPLQGSASDIIKLAMIHVFDRINAEKLKSKMILQIHDELLVDTYPGEEKVVKEILKQEMENILNLKVKLIVEIGKGKNWFDAK